MQIGNLFDRQVDMWEIIEQVLYGKEESEGRDDGKIEGGKK